MSENAERHGYCRKSVDKSISEAIRSGRLDATANGAVITGARRVADAIDTQGSAAPASLYGTFLAYCKALNLTPSPKPTASADRGGKLSEIRERSMAKLNGEGLPDMSDKVRAKLNLA